MATLKTTDLVLPREVIYEMSKKVQEKSVVASLASSEIQTFDSPEYMVFDHEPEAEVVTEGGAKSSDDPTFAPIKATGHKLQVTVRTSDEVKWADEDGQLEVLNLITGSFSGAIARGIDALVLHGISPLEKNKVPGVTGLVDQAQQVTATGNIQEDIDALPDLVIAEGYDVDGVALDRLFANEARKLRYPTTGVKIYPELGMNLDPSNLDGLRAVVSGAVSNARYVPTNVQAIIGLWELIKYGIVRNITVTPIEYGDPDGRGDLQRYNQIAFRAETYLAYANFDPNGFAVLRGATDNGGGDDGGNGDGDDGGNGDDTKTKSSK